MEGRRIKTEIPDYIATSLWSYDAHSLDIKKDKKIIITQVLNYGDPERIKWLHTVYSDEDIKEVIMDPLRGRWFDKTLNFWEIILKIRVPEEIREKAIFRL